MMSKCPGYSRIIQPKPEIYKCPYCGGEVEIWTDEIKAVCPSCKNIFVRETQIGCVDWCKYARECAGEAVYKRYMENKIVTIKQKLLSELKKYFGEDTEWINHAKSVMKFAEEILKKERADWHIVIPASILHDIGIKETKNKYGSSEACYQEIEGPEIARNILLKLGLKKEDIDEVCEIIANHHTPGKINTLNFKVLYDAVTIVNLKQKLDLYDKAKIKDIVNKVFLTETGKEISKKEFNLI